MEDLQTIMSEWFTYKNHGFATAVKWIGN